MEKLDVGMVTFVGAGPGDPGLLTIKGKEAIAEAELVLYAGSLVPREIVAFANARATIRDSAPLTLEENHALVRSFALAGKKVARVHTGDPSLYAALCEQVLLLDRDGIPWRIIPGVTAACAAAAAAGVSFTTPEIVQSLVITRMPGRTPMRESENIASFAKHGCSMAIYLSTNMAHELQKQLLSVLPEDTPVICANRVGWSDEKLVKTTLSELASCVTAHCFDRQTVFLVLTAQTMIGPNSRLYDKNFSHSFRTSKK